MAHTRQQSRKSDERYPGGKIHLPSGPTDASSPILFLLVTAASVLVGEILVFFLVSTLRLPYNSLEALLNAVIVTILVFPVLYLLVFRRMRRQVQRLLELERSLRQSETDYRNMVRDQSALIAEYKDVLQELEEARDGLEQKVQQRTVEMAQINRDLRAEVATRRAAENALQTSEAQLRQFIGQIPAILWTMDKDLRLTSLVGSRLPELRPRLEAVLRRMGGDAQAAGVTGEGVAEPADASVLQAHALALQGQSTGFELRLDERDYHCTVEPYRSDEGVLVGCVGIALDITASQQREELIRLQSTALEAAANGIMITDPGGIILWCNPALAAMTGYSAAELIGQTPALFSSGRHAQTYFTNLWNTIRSGQVWRGETYNRRKDGSLYVEDQTITPVVDQTGRISHYISIKQEITGRKESEEKIARRNWELQALNTISSTVSTSLELSRTFALVKQLLYRELAIPSGAVFSYDPARDHFRLETAWGSTGSLLGASPLAFFDHTLAVREKKPVLSTIPIPSFLPLSPEEDPVEPGRLALLCIPLLSQGELQGILDLSISGSKIRRDEPLDFLESLGNQIGVAIQNAKLYKAELEAHRLAETLRDASLALNSSLDLDVVIQTILDSVERIVPGAERISLLSLEDGFFQITAVGGKKTPEGPIPPQLFDLNDYPLLREIVETRSARLVDDPSADPLWRPVFRNVSTGSWLGVPVVIAGKVIGVCGVASEIPGCFSQQHVSITAALLGQAAAAIQNATLYQEVSSGRERLQTLSHRLINVQEMERRTIARELHDETSQALIGLVFALDNLKRDAANPQAVTAGVENLGRLIREILDSLHRLAVNLRPSALDYLGLAPAIRQYIEGIQEKSALVVDLTTQLPGRLPAEMETILYRIIQEALANVVLHAQATRAEVSLEQVDRQVRVVIEDNGRGFDLDKALAAERLGLFGMRERVEMLGGSLTIHSTPGEGTQISLEAPL